MKQIEEGLNDLHTKARETNTIDNGSPANTEGKPESPFSTDVNEAIAKVDRVEAYSPASTAVCRYTQKMDVMFETII